MRELLRDHLGRNYRMDSVEHYRAVLDELPDLHAAHLDLGAAYSREGQADPAERHIRRALELGYPVPDLALNYLAGLAGRRGDFEGMKARFQQAARAPHPHPLIVRNRKVLSAWLDSGGRSSGQTLNLVMRHDFEVIPAGIQPIVPAPLPQDAWKWPPGPNRDPMGRRAPPEPALAGRQEKGS